MKRLAALIAATLLLASPVFAQQAQPAPGTQPAMPVPSTNATLSLGASTQKVPAGTFLNVVFDTAMDSRITNSGEPFSVTLANDFDITQHNVTRIILPKGTLIRGRVDEVKRPGFFSHGGAIFLTFDHAVLPSGELMPLDLKLSTENTKVNKLGALYSDPGIPKKLGDAAHSGVGTFDNILNKGVTAGKGMADGFGTILTVPAAAIGGAIAGTAITTGKGAVAIVGRGESIVINPGDSVTIDFGGSFNLPAE